MQILNDPHDAANTRHLRNALRSIIDIDENGNEARVFVAVGNLHISAVSAIAVDQDGDLILISDHARCIMEDLESWSEFITD